MNRNAMKDKYMEVVKAVATANDCDLDVAYDKLKYMVMYPEGEKYPGVPDDFDWEAFKADLQR